MIKFFVGFATTLLVMALWAVLTFTSTLNGWFQEAIAAPGQTQQFMDAAVARLESESKGNVVMALIEDGELFASHAQSVGRAVDLNTPFQAASVSKWLTAWGVMSLVDEGKLDLDAPIATYLTRWQLPPSEFDNNAVTARRLLSHTAGLTDGLGYSGFDSATQMQTLEASLTSPHASSKDQDHAIEVGIAPGSQFVYSGGGYTLLQLMIEEISGQPFETYMRERILNPLGMKHTSYSAFEDPSVADQYRLDGSISPHLYWTNTAAASVYTSANDMIRFLLSHVAGHTGEHIGRGTLTPDSVHAMQQPEASMMGMGIWGMGPILQAPNEDGGFVLGGGGLRTDPAINADVRINPATGNGIVILQSGNRALASDLASQWTFWETGKLDLFLVREAGDGIARTIILGWAVIVAVALLWLIVRRRLRKRDN